MKLFFCNTAKHFLLVAVFFSFLSLPAHATVTPGAEQQSFKDREAERKMADKVQRQVQEPTVEIQDDEPVAEGLREIPLSIDTIEVGGNTVVSDEEIRKIVAPYEGKTLTLSQAREAALKITEHYRKKGYITCRAYIPPQELSDRILRIELLEGKVGEITVQGNKFFSKERITRYVDKLQGKVVQYNDLQRSLEKANLHPDRDVKAVIVPGKTVGTSDLLLDVDDYFPLHIGGEVNNFGTKETGRERYSVHARHTNVFGWDHILAVRAQYGEEVFVIGGQYVVPLGDHGTQIGATANYTDVGVGGDFSVLDISGQAYSYSVFLNHPLFENDSWSATWTGSYESKRIDNSILGEPSSRDDLRIFHTGLNLDINDPWGRTYIVNDFAFGVPWLGASHKHDPRLSRADAGASFFKYTGALNRVHPLWWDFTYLLFKGAVQLSPDRLVSAEQFDLGGVYSVRGYPQSDYLGDYGGTASVELRVPFHFLDHDIKVPGTDVPLWNRLNFVAFADWGYASLRSPAVGELEDRYFAGVGGGLRFDLPKNLTGRFEWATPVGDDPSDGSNSQFYFSVSGDLV